MSNPEPLTRRELLQDELLADFMSEIEEWQSQIEGTPTERHMDELRHIYGFARARMDSAALLPPDQPSQARSSRCQDRDGE